MNLREAVEHYLMGELRGIQSIEVLDQMRENAAAGVKEARDRTPVFDIHSGRTDEYAVRLVRAEANQMLWQAEAAQWSGEERVV